VAIPLAVCKHRIGAETAAASIAAEQGMGDRRAGNRRKKPVKQRRKMQRMVLCLRVLSAG